MESILVTIKELLDSRQDSDDFDKSLIVFINSTIATLSQIGLTPIEAGFLITGTDETWKDYIGDRPELEMVKNYIYLKTKIAFDPPLSGTVMEVMKEQIKELESRINILVD